MPEQKPLSDKMKAVLVAILDLDERGKTPATPNEIGSACGFRPGMAHSGNSGRGNSTRVMGVAVHVTTTLMALSRNRGLVYSTRRRDGLSGTAFDLTVEGEAEARRARAAGITAASASAGRRTRHEEALDAIRRRD